MSEPEEKPKIAGAKNENDYDERIHYWASQYGLPFVIGKALVAAESRFDARAWRAEPHLDQVIDGEVFREGSRGLTQILFRTAQGIGYKGEPDGLFDADLNLKFGLKYLSRQLQRGSYSLPDAIAAYNMGHARPISKTTPHIAKIYRYPIEYKNDPPEGWAYANQPYVNKILFYAAFYLAVEQGNRSAIAEIQALVKKKVRPNTLLMWSWTVGSTEGRRRITSCSFDWPRLSTTG